MSKILLVINNAFSYAGTENVCNFMTESFGVDNVIDIISLDGTGNTFYPYENVNKITTLSGDKLKYLSLLKYIRSNEYDFIFVISMGKLSFIFRWLGLFFNNENIKIYACEHVAFETFSSWVKRLKINAFKWYDSVIVLTENDLNILKNKKIKCLKIVNPIKYQNFVRSERTKIALAVGRLDSQKGFIDLIDLWSEFVSDYPDWNLLIAGEGYLRGELEDKIIANNLSKSVHLLGKVSNIEELYKNSDFLLMTSLYEGLPLVLLEAKSWSLPVVAYDCPTGPKEIIFDTVDGFLIHDRNRQQFIDKMKVLASDMDLLIKMSSSTKTTHLYFDVKKIKKQWVELINLKGFL